MNISSIWTWFNLPTSVGLFVWTTEEIFSEHCQRPFSKNFFRGCNMINRYCFYFNYWMGWWMAEALCCVKVHVLHFFECLIFSVGLVFPVHLNLGSWETNINPDVTGVSFITMRQGHYLVQMVETISVQDKLHVVISTSQNRSLWCAHTSPDVSSIPQACWVSFSSPHSLVFRNWGPNSEIPLREQGP